MFNSKLMYVLFYLYVYVYYSFFGEGVGMLSPNQCMMMIDVAYLSMYFLRLHYNMFRGIPRISWIYAMVLQGSSKPLITSTVA